MGLRWTRWSRWFRKVALSNLLAAALGALVAFGLQQVRQMDGQTSTTAQTQVPLSPPRFHLSHRVLHATAAASLAASATCQRHGECWAVRQTDHMAKVPLGSC